MTITPEEEAEMKKEYAWVMDIDKSRYQDVKMIDGSNRQDDS